MKTTICRALFFFWNILTLNGMDDLALSVQSNQEIDPNTYRYEVPNNATIQEPMKFWFEQPRTEEVQPTRQKKVFKCCLDTLQEYLRVRRGLTEDDSKKIIGQYYCTSKKKQYKHLLSLRQHMRTYHVEPYHSWYHSTNPKTGQSSNIATRKKALALNINNDHGSSPSLLCSKAIFLDYINNHIRIPLSEKKKNTLKQQFQLLNCCKHPRTINGLYKHIRTKHLISQCGLRNISN